MDLADLKKKRPPIGKTALKTRVKNLWATKKAKEVAKNYFMSFKKVCKEVIDKKGAATRA